MRNSMKRYLGWGATVVAVGALMLLLFFGIYKLDALLGALSGLLSILSPVLFGIAIAYVLSPAYNWLRARLRRLLCQSLHWRGRRALRCADVLAMTGTFLGAGALVAGMLWLLIPQLISSVSNFVFALPANLLHASQTLQGLLADNPELEQHAMLLYARTLSYIEQWVQTSLAPSAQEALGYVSAGLMNTVALLKNLLIGVIVAIYLLAGKSGFLRQIRRSLYAVLGARGGNLFLRYARYAHQMFSGFIGGMLIDSFFVFLICCVALPLMHMPYAMLVSVIVAVTNIIPFFGPFIGAAPSFVIILIDDPIKSIYFLIYILILQQLDGNILAPKILGNSTGLSSFWVLFAILLFGGLFGFVGMLLGVPLFAVLHRMVSDGISRLLARRRLPDDPAAYAWLDYIDETTGQPVKRQRAPACGAGADAPGDGEE